MIDQGLQKTVVVGIFVIFIACAVLLLNQYCIYTPDSARYLSLALSLASGQGYLDLHTPGKPIHVNFPPGYPAILIPTAWVAPGHLILAGKMLNILVSVGALLVLYRMLARISSPLRSIVIIGVMALNPFFIVHSAEVLSESSYLLISSVAIWLIIDSDNLTPGRTMAAGAMAGIGCLTRYIGISLILTGIAVLLLRKEWKKCLIFFAAAVVITAPWGIREFFHTLGNEEAVWGYASSIAASSDAASFSLGEILRRLSGGFVRYNIVTQHLLFPFLFLIETGLAHSLSPMFLDKMTSMSIPLLLIYPFVFLFILMGVYQCAKHRTKRPVVIYLFAYGLILTLYPVREVRFLIPILVFIWMVIFEGIIFGSQLLRISRSRLRLGLIVLAPAYLIASLICTVCLILSNPSLRERLPWDIPTATRFKYNLRKVSTWLKDNTPPDAVVLCERPELFLLSGRQIVSGGQYTAVFGVFEETLKTVNVSYIVDYAPSGVGISHRLMANALMFDFELAAQFPRMLIHKVTPRETPREPPGDSYDNTIVLLLAQAEERPREPEVYQELGYFYFKEGRLDEAAEVFRQALGLDPGCPVTWFNLGSAYLDMERYDEAISAFEKALAVRSADLIASLAEPSIKLAKLKQTIRENPSDRRNFHRRIEAAALYFQMKEFSNTVTELEAASMLRPELADPHFLMGQCYERMGRKDEAIKAYLTALEIQPGNDEILLRLRKLGREK
jgi:Flp pilus assembly protein TadD/4-amino-4-deoxy-L-arabinose transferase-like glycosyltransferase